MSVVTLEKFQCEICEKVYDSHKQAEDCWKKCRDKELKKIECGKTGHNPVSLTYLVYDPSILSHKSSPFLLIEGSCSCDKYIRIKLDLTDENVLRSIYDNNKHLDCSDIINVVPVYPPIAP